VDVLLQRDDRIADPWRAVALIAAAVAAVELLLLVVLGGALIAKPASGTPSRPEARAAAARSAAVVKIHRASAPAARLPRGKVAVLVLNGNGRRGAAAAAASTLARHGYRVSGVANAPRSDFTRSLVMYRRGFEGEARRLARDLGIQIVGPLDGLQASQLHGAHAVLVVGA